MMTEVKGCTRRRRPVPVSELSSLRNEAIAAGNEEEIMDVHDLAQIQGDFGLSVLAPTNHPSRLEHDNHI